MLYWTRSNCPNTLPRKRQKTHLSSNLDAPINNETNVVNSDGESVGELIGETFTYQEVTLSHCILRDSSDFNDLFIKDNVVRVLAKEDIS